MKRANPAVHIIAGRWKRRRLDVPAGARPTSARAREALFSILGEKIAGARFLDLYAGSGAIGLEAASRGARRVVLVEKRSEALARTIERFSPDPGEVSLLSSDIVPALVSLMTSGERFDFAFADPPYAARGEDAICDLIPPLLAPGGAFILQKDAGEEAPAPQGLAPIDRREYGRNVFFFFADRGGAAFDREGPRC